MRLINTTTLKLKQYLGEEDELPPYAILSHTWTDDEVTFQDIESKRAEARTGFEKLQCFCALAREYGFDYAWMDTCCINKTSSAELSEAINSMFRWYQNSSACFAYLEDVDDGNDPEREGSEFRKSRWFSRGWTLQELIAPKIVLFLSSSWKQLGSKSEDGVDFCLEQHWQHTTANLCELLSSVTEIDSAVLVHPRNVLKYSVAQRMSWAADRKTTRPEDISYCLLGLFDINMPLLYGEGKEKAFNRLQEEILRKGMDDTLFMNISRNSGGYIPPLARSPGEFRGLGTITTGMNELLFRKRSIPSQMTPKGLQIQLPICRCRFVVDKSENPRDWVLSIPDTGYIAILDCVLPGSYLDRGAIFLTKLSNGIFARVGNSVVSRLEFESREIIFHVVVKGKATSIETHKLRLETFIIRDYSFEEIMESSRLNETSERFRLRGISQAREPNVLLDAKSQQYVIRRKFLVKTFQMWRFLNVVNSKAFNVLLGAYESNHGHEGDKSVPYCKIFECNPNWSSYTMEYQERGFFFDRVDEEGEKMYLDEDPDSTQGRDGSKRLPSLSRPARPQRVTLELDGSRIAVVTTDLKSFLGREEHSFELKIEENA